MGPFIFFALRQKVAVVAIALCLVAPSAFAAPCCPGGNCDKPTWQQTELPKAAVPDIPIPETPKTVGPVYWLWASNIDAMLCAEAQKHAEYMASVRVQEHQNWSSRKSRCEAAVGLRCEEIVAESWPNRSYAGDDDQWKREAFGSWKFSSGHWEVARKAHTRVGWGRARGGNGVWYFCVIAADGQERGKVTSPPAAQQPAISPTEAYIVARVNAERRARGLRELVVDSKLMDFARNHTRWMFRGGMVHSRGPYAENIAMGQSDGEDVMHSWMNSSGHRSNILNPNHRYIGAAGMQDANGRTYYTQNFR
ncbi:CAP domain-containing protein [Candidatus Pacearchaeota archaeon]|jgi:uncharacterized protein YkwD|nr:CAP domain-containing protein [Candidatus Pacearchaeota archaeon]